MRELQRRLREERQRVGGDVGLCIRAEVRVARLAQSVDSHVRRAHHARVCSLYLDARSMCEPTVSQMRL
jgi:hypothetical protein